MISLKKLTATLISLIFINLAIAQDLLTLVPKHASFVGMINAGQNIREILKF